MARKNAASPYLAAVAKTAENQAVSHELWLTGQTPQSEKAAPTQKKNNAGGFTFTLNEMERLGRFLILGADKPTYYASARTVAVDNAQVVVGLIKKGRGLDVVDFAKEISLGGRAAKNAPAIFAIGLVATTGTPVEQKAAYDALPHVCRTATDMFAFVEVIKQQGKWNNAAKRGVANWYTSKKNDQIAYQAVKYQQRNGWAHRDVLRLAHVKPVDAQMAELFHWIAKDHTRKNMEVTLPEIIDTFEELKRARTDNDVVKLIQTRKGVSWEMIPTEFYKSSFVWEALLPTMGYTALIRKLGQLSAAGLLKPMSSSFKVVRDRLQDEEGIRKARVHPISILNALAVYRQGRGDKGSLSWDVNTQMLNVITDAFYGSFKVVDPTGENMLIGIDCSGSMWGYKVGAFALNAAEVAACMALATMRVEKNYWIGGFNTSMAELKISPTMSLDAVMNVMQKFNWGGTDCAQPMLHAMKNDMHNVDKFVVYTDNETWAGKVHPHEAIKRYRSNHVEHAKVIVAGVCSTQFSIADPADPGMLDIVGFDSAAPQLISAF